MYKHIRHRVYPGETLRNWGLVVIFSSVYGISLMATSTGFLLFRVRIEDKMLIEVLGREYEEYQRKTKRLIPYTYWRTLDGTSSSDNVNAEPIFFVAPVLSCGTL